MKLIAVYNVFDGEEFLERSIKSIRENVDEVIVVVQNRAYNGFKYTGGIGECYRLMKEGLIDYMSAWEGTKQIDKRQYCLDLAIERGATHYLGMDCDELYDPKDFKKAKEIALEHKGSYCKIKTYFKSDDLTIGEDNYYVPFIHKVSKGEKTGRKGYPVLVDPRRSIVSDDVVEVPLTMLHYSWVRNDINIKIKSHDSARLIKKTGLLDDYHNAKEGSYIKHYDKILVKDV